MTPTARLHLRAARPSHGRRSAARTVGRWAFAFLLAAGLLASGSRLAAQSDFSPALIDRRADACVDFYQFACGGWLERTSLPPDRARYGRMQELADRNEQIIREILEDAARRRPGRTPAEQRIGDAYAACMDTAAIERAGLRPLAPYLRAIGRASSPAALLRVAATLAHDGIGAFLTVSTAPDIHDSTHFMAQIGQGTLGLPDRDLYLQSDARALRLREAYTTHLSAMFGLLGDTPDAARAHAAAVLRLELALARVSMDRFTFRDVRQRDNPMTVAGLRAVAPDLDLVSFLRAAGVPQTVRVNVVSPAYLEGLQRALATEPVADWQTYLRWRVLDTAAPWLTTAFQQEDFHFKGTVLNGQAEPRPRSQRCSAAVAGEPGADALGELVGQVFVQRRFGAFAQARITALVDALQRSLQRTLGGATWMDAETTRAALDKLSALRRKVGAPTRWRAFDGVVIRRADHAGNMSRIRADDTQRQLAWAGQVVDRDLWLITPQTVNAFYLPPLNEVVFPAGILQPPFFDATKDDAVNFGAIGSMIGHELSHAFDASGRRFDRAGNLVDWWTPGDDQRFTQRSACLVDQYTQYPVVDGVRVDGRLTLSENIADNTGVRIALYALIDQLASAPPQALIDGFTPEQRFFLSWAQTWCEQASDASIRRRAQEDVHAPNRWRTNGVLQNLDEFRKAFGCATGARMAPARVCRVW